MYTPSKPNDTNNGMLEEIYAESKKSFSNKNRGLPFSDAYESDDIFHDSILKYLIKFKEGKIVAPNTPEQLKALLKKMSKDQQTDILRTNEHHARYVNHEFNLAGQLDTNEAEKKDEREFANELAKRFLSVLDDRQREVIVLKFYEEKTSREIAESMGISSEENVRQIVCTAMKKMKEAMGEILR